MKTYILMLLLAISGTADAFTNWQTLSNKDLLDTLDLYLENVDKYDAAARRDIQQIKRLMLTRPASERAAIYGRIGDRYATIALDSAQHYYDLGITMAQINRDRETINRLHMARIRTMPYQGLVHEAIRDLEALNPEKMNPRMRSEYFYTMHLVYLNATELHPADSVTQRYMDQAMRAVDSMMVYADIGSEQRRITELWMSLYPNSGRYNPKAAANLLKIADTMTLSSPLADETAEMLSFIAGANADTTALIHSLALASIIDVSNSNYLSSNLHKLGKVLYASGDVKRAYRYLTTSLDRSLRSGATMRSIEAAEALPLAMDTAARRGNTNSNLYIVIMLILALLSGLLVLQLILVHRHRTRLTEYHRRLAEANDTKDIYMQRLLEIYGDNIDNLVNFNRLAARKIKAAQVKELLHLIEEDTLLQRQLRDFYRVFDKAFLAIHPNFIDRLNSLLVESERFGPMPVGTLNAELRMIALMVMGVTEPAQLAKFLGLSVNTVYTYRNKFRKRAIDRLNFEDNLAALSRLS